MPVNTSRCRGAARPRRGAPRAGGGGGGPARPPRSGGGGPPRGRGGRAAPPGPGPARRAARRGAGPPGGRGGEPPVLVGVLQGAFVFMADLVRAMPIDLATDFVRVESLRRGVDTAW